MFSRVRGSGARREHCLGRRRRPCSKRRVVNREIDLKGSLGAAIALLLLLTPSGAKAGHYVFDPGPQKETLILDNQTGRVWRYDRADDAWYLYDLEALTPSRADNPTISRAPAGVTQLPLRRPDVK